MNSLIRLSVSILALSLSLSAASAETARPYAGMEGRSISSLSEDDLRDLRSGAGWGLALPAELNGYPGPAHVLELAEALDLTEAQRQKTEAIFAVMREEAIAKGAALIDAEADLDAAFRSGGLTPEGLVRLISNAERARTALRIVHLSRHLEMITHLSPAQIRTYAKLRGYAGENGAEGDGGDAHRNHGG